MSEDILALCRAMGAGEEQDSLLLPLIEGARAELEHLLRRGVAPEECGESFALAAAMLAVDGLAAAQAALPPGSCPFSCGGSEGAICGSGPFG